MVDAAVGTEATDACADNGECFGVSADPRPRPLRVPFSTIAGWPALEKLGAEHRAEVERLSTAVRRAEEARRARDEQNKKLVQVCATLWARLAHARNRSPTARAGGLGLASFLTVRLMPSQALSSTRCDALLLRSCFGDWAAPRLDGVTACSKRKQNDSKTLTRQAAYRTRRKRGVWRVA